MGHKYDADFWWVYALVDPRTDEAFYVGCSSNPKRRLLSHKADWFSAANGRLRCLKRLGLECRLELLDAFIVLDEAVAFERQAIFERPYLENHRRGGRPWCSCSGRGGLCDGWAAWEEFLAARKRVISAEEWASVEAGREQAEIRNGLRTPDGKRKIRP
jgi:predicted GIY-YIG superfamily endonuclease